MGISQRASHSRRDFECAVADDAADAVCDDDVARTGRQRRIAACAAGGAGARGDPRRSSRRLEPSEERTDIKNEGFPWPGDWTVERDEARQKTTVHWKGKDGYEYPWGKQNDFENLTYDGDDAHPETCSVRGEAESVFALKGRTLIWRGHLLVTTDQKNFYYKYTRELLKDGQMMKSKTWQETIPRDHQ